MLQPMSTSDSELIMVVFANLVSEVLTKRSRMQLISNINDQNSSASPRSRKRPKVNYLTPANLLQVANELQDQMCGGYAVVMVFQDLGILAFRDCHGIRPMVLGKRRRDARIIDLREGGVWKVVRTNSQTTNLFRCDFCAHL